MDRINMIWGDGLDMMHLDFDRSKPEDVEHMLEIFMIHIIHADSELRFVITPQGK